MSILPTEALKRTVDAAESPIPPAVLSSYSRSSEMRLVLMAASTRPSVILNRPLPSATVVVTSGQRSVPEPR